MVVDEGILLSYCHQTSFLVISRAPLSDRVLRHPFSSGMVFTINGHTVLPSSGPKPGQQMRGRTESTTNSPIHPEWIQHESDAS